MNRVRSLDKVAADLGISIRIMDSEFGDPQAEVTVRLNSAALASLVRSPRKMGAARAYMRGDLLIDGDLDVVADLEVPMLQAVRRHPFEIAGAFLRNPSWIGEMPNVGKLPEEYPTRWFEANKRRLSRIEHHYDLPVLFYRLILGPTLVYSGADFTKGASTLDQAQLAKLDDVTQSFDLSERKTFLDLGCGWGSLMFYVAETYGCHATGITLSKVQADFIAQEAKRLGLADRIKVVLDDASQFLDHGSESYDAIASLGMYEHVKAQDWNRFFSLVRFRLKPGARYVHQAITRSEGHPEQLVRNGFIQRVIFPQGQLRIQSDTLTSMNRAGLSVVRYNELSQSYRSTIRCWIRNLEEHQEEVEAIVGVRLTRAWKLYLAGCERRFRDGSIFLFRTVCEIKG